MRTERQPAFVDEVRETRVVVVGAVVEAPREQAGIVFAFFRVRQIAVARIEALGQQQATDAVAVFLELGRVRELVGVAIRMVGPDVLDLVASTAALSVFDITRRLADRVSI
jgi:hypothetical protein